MFKILLKKNLHLKTGWCRSGLEDWGKPLGLSEIAESLMFLLQVPEILNGPLIEQPERTTLGD